MRCLFWPGSEAEIAGSRPTHWEPFDGSKPYETRVRQVLDWLDLPEGDRPRMITLYFQDPNDTSHIYGPEAPETYASIREVDARIGDLVAGIEKRRLTDRVKLVVASDHGQDPADPRMHGLFIAHGPGFRSGLVIDRFASIDIYNLLASVLELDPAPNDGNLATLRSVLTGTE